MKNLCLFVLLLAGCGRHPIRDTSYHADTPRVTRDRGPEPSPEKDPVTPVKVQVPEELPTDTAVTVTLPKPKSEPQRIADVNGASEDAFFAYDRSDLTEETLAALRRDAVLLRAILTEFPGLKVTIEGHCDERGSAQYNLGLGERRARRAEAILSEFGVPASAVEVVSYGKEAPQCTQANEDCYRTNRRAHMAVRR